jgi:hypothetical protein
MKKHTLRNTVFGFAFALGLNAPAIAATSPTLQKATSDQLQTLLSLQSRQTLAVFSNHAPPRTPRNTFDRLFMWNDVALDTTAIDHTPVQPGETRVFGEQFGPHRTSRALAIVQIAAFEAVNAVAQNYQSYAHVAPVNGDVSVDYAIAQASHDALVYLYPSQQPRLDAILAADVAHIGGDAKGLAAGKALGIAAAQAIVALRSADGSQYVEPIVGGPFTPIGGIGHWSPDPVSNSNVYLGAYWGAVKPFTLTAGSQFRAPPPPALTDPAYTKAFKAVSALGGDPAFGTPTIRTKQQTFEGIFWTYDGTPSLCAPPRMYNQVARALVLQRGMNSVPEAARMLALINTALADAGISAWETKWHYQFWRPVTAIRSPDQGGNPNTKSNPTWYPLGGQATNSHGPNFTPPFPAYVSGHATFGGALFEILRHYYPDKTPFTFISDEYNGTNRSDTGQLMPFRPMNYSSLTDAEYQNAESRIYIGVHWQFDADQGIAEGHRVADWVWDHAFQPVKAHID